MKKFTSLQIKFFLITALSTFIACEKETSVDILDNESGIEVQDFQNEIAFPGQTGTTEYITFRGETVPATKINNEFVINGDIIVSPDTLDIAKKSTAKIDRLWPNNIVYFEVNGDLPDRNRVYDAIAHWETNTNLHFVKRVSEEAYIEFIKSDGCSSQLGRSGGRQFIKLGPNCSTGNTIHEIGHAVGLLHEHARADQEDYVTIIYDNIKEGKESNFYSWKRRGFDGDDLTADMDFGSIMMYGPTFFSKNGKKTIVRNNGRSYSAQRSSLSAQDIAGINKLYPKVGQKLGIRGNNNRYISSENGRKNITITKSSLRSWETFYLINLGNGKYAIEGNNGKYISSENGNKPMTCNRTRIGSQEQFSLERLDGLNYAIKGNNGRYVTSNNGSTRRGVKCDRSRAGGWEKFIFITAL